MKKDATDYVHAKLLSTRNLNVNSTLSQSARNNDDSTIARLLRENAELKSALERESKKIYENVPKDNTNALQACLERIEQKLKNIDNVKVKLESVEKVNFEKFQELEIKLASVEDTISKLPKPISQYMQYWLNSLLKNENIFN